MIRNGYPRRLRAQEQRARLSGQWQAYPDAVQHCLHTLLQEYGFHAATLATEALQQALTWQQGLRYPSAPVAVENLTAFPAITHRCLYQGPAGRCFQSTGSVFLHYCATHQDVLLPP